MSETNTERERVREILEHEEAEIRAIQERRREIAVAAATGALERLEADYRERKAEIRADPGLSWEKRELKVRELGKEYDQARKRARGEGAG